MALHTVWWWLIVRAIPRRFSLIVVAYLLVVAATARVFEFDPKRLYELVGDSDSLIGQIGRGIVDFLATIWLLLMFVGGVLTFPFAWLQLLYMELCPSLSCFGSFRGRGIRPAWLCMSALSVAASSLVVWWQGRDSAAAKRPTSKIKNQQ